MAACPRFGPDPRVHADAACGGFKQSGLGRECGPEGLDAFTEIKNIITWIALQPFRWY